MITKVKALFYRDVRYVIPSYQRAYSWEGQQREQFIEDLRDVSDKYYLGHFLFEKTENGSVLCLIDGQQRLTTIVIFFQLSSSRVFQTFFYRWRYQEDM